MYPYCSPVYVWWVVAVELQNGVSKTVAGFTSWRFGTPGWLPKVQCISSSGQVDCYSFDCKQELVKLVEDTVNAKNPG